MQPWKHLKDPEVIGIGWRTVVRKTFERPDGVEAEYVTFNHPEARSGGVIALTPENMVIIADQFRPGPEMIMCELPGGGIKPDENPQEAVMRELAEETGYTSDEVTLLGAVYKDAYTNSLSYYYLARNCVPTGTQTLDDGEFVSVGLISIDELIDNAKTGKMSDAQPVLMAYELLKTLQEETL